MGESRVLRVTIDLPDDAPPEEVERIVREYTDRIDRAYRALGGSGLKINSVEVYEPAYKAEIDAMTVEELLRVVRFAPAGDERMQGERGKYHLARMDELRAQDPAAYVAASKRLG